MFLYPHLIFSSFSITSSTFIPFTREPIPLRLPLQPPIYSTFCTIPVSYTHLDVYKRQVIPIRGKILNCLKADYVKIFKNDIITDLIKVLGCGVEVSSKANKDISSFNLENFRWSKVVICTDADVDGFQIRTLILTTVSYTHLVRKRWSLLRTP